MKIFSFVISIVALVLALVAFACDSNGICKELLLSAIVPVCATIIVGIHFIDTYKLEKLEGKQNEMKQEMMKLQEIEKQVEDMRQNANIALHIAWGLAYTSWDPSKAIKECWNAIELSIKANDPKRTETCFNAIEYLKNRFDNEQKEYLIRPKKDLEEKLKDYPLYASYRCRIKNLIDKQTDNSK